MGFWTKLTGGKESEKETLIEASENGQREVVQALLKKGVDVNAKDKYGDTALIEASLKGYREVVQELLANKADVNAKKKDGETALTACLSR